MARLPIKHVEHDDKGDVDDFDPSVMHDIDDYNQSDMYDGQDYDVGDMYMYDIEVCDLL